jgi:hypothetical protein
VVWLVSSKTSSTYFRTVIPEILNDGRRLLQPWERAGSLDPFEKIYEVSQLLFPPLCPLPEMAPVEKDCHPGALQYLPVPINDAIADPLPISACVPSHRTVSDVHGDS